MNNEQLAAIIARVADNTATDEDISVYNAWCNSLQEQDLELNDLSDIEAQTLRNIQKQTGQVRRFVIIRRIAAAAVITGILAGSLYLYRYTNRSAVRPTPAATIAINNNISSGKNTATLTLANGKKIVLADSQDGKLTEQAGSEVTKTADGALEYHPVATGTVAPQYNKLSTARGEQYQITLPDGTKVWLNASTTLTFPTSFANMAARKVEVTGEAYFEVVADPAHPFIVNASKQEIKVLGTHFNINNYLDEPFAKTTLLQGAVKINNEKTLTPGQQAISSKDGSLRIATVSTEAAIAWKNGYFEFNDENIYEIMRKIARWYNVEVIYEGDIPMNEMEGTISRYENVSKVLNTIQKAGLLKFRIEQKKIYVNKY
ncbi:FecR family protein [Chitinophaga sp. RAB17]|uniref:FecR family protein n=1 Tax=Chitinophaga sp. RAB17 TaxID=3233049 RepID=UPI003F8EEEEA